MRTIIICPECHGKGTYKIYNAYEPEFEEEITCECCDGEGVLDAPLTPVRKKTRRDDEWVN
jgi:DnaJ-class molecular chaperone